MLFSHIRKKHKNFTNFEVFKDFTHKNDKTACLYKIEKILTMEKKNEIEHQKEKILEKPYNVLLSNCKHETNFCLLDIDSQDKIKCPCCHNENDSFSFSSDGESVLIKSKENFKIDDVWTIGSVTCKHKTTHAIKPIVKNPIIKETFYSKTISTKSETFFCKYCGLSCESFESFYYHVALNHIFTSTCSECPYKSFNVSDAKTHDIFKHNSKNLKKWENIELQQFKEECLIYSEGKPDLPSFFFTELEIPCGFGINDYSAKNLNFTYEPGASTTFRSKIEIENVN